MLFIWFIPTRRKFATTLSENSWKCSPQNSNRYIVFLRRLWRQSMRKKISAEVRIIHAEQMSLYNFIILGKQQWTQMKTKQLKQDSLNQ